MAHDLGSVEGRLSLRPDGGLGVNSLMSLSPPMSSCHTPIERFHHQSLVVE
jgi:hypothetical protein